MTTHLATSFPTILKASFVNKPKAPTWHHQNVPAQSARIAKPASSIHMTFANVIYEASNFDKHIDIQ